MEEEGREAEGGKGRRKGERKERKGRKEAGGGE